MIAIELFTVVSSTILLFIATVRFIVWICDRKDKDNKNDHDQKNSNPS